MLVVENLPANADRCETGVQVLGREGPLEEGVATHQYSCLEKPHAIHRVTQSLTQLSD